MRALWSDRPNCSHNVSQKVKRIRCISEKRMESATFNWREFFSGIFKGGDLNPGERHSRDTRDDGTVTLCTPRAATVLSRDCCADFGRPLAKKVMSPLYCHAIVAQILVVP